ncbi:hypothetical protein UZ35_15355 [Heyndrickxia coagulans]|nr:hypothetical protein BIZ35_07155 [Heyndrickxia coagulans]KGB28839.1 hypothetical protein IE89_14800 [Heyndrickxia coagulans]KGT39908.1 hypothetical protein P421_02335 [Heyndrickxia coagulans P38]KXT19404.1 hypothetical protein UZ35_15355 [Heyndrickxia coagulans]KYC64940.1 hypothetical protein B4100_2818 [Heyndrickxia coagulans]
MNKLPVRYFLKKKTARCGFKPYGAVANDIYVGVDLHKQHRFKPYGAVANVHRVRDAGGFFARHFPTGFLYA